MKCPTCGNDNPEDAQFCGGCGASRNGTGDLTPIIMEYFDNYSGKTSKNIRFGNEIPNQLLEKHKKRYLDLSSDEQVLVLLEGQYRFGGAFTGLAITNKRIHYFTLKKSIFTSMLQWWLKGPKGSKIIADLESIEIAQLDSCLGTSYVGHELRINDEILGYVRMGRGVMYDQNAKEFLNGLFNHFAQHGILEREVNSYWWS
jgi:hypothetical protein